ncbi:MAG: CDP-glucose 4,6-dehydratase [Pseudomonadota bacterium]
MFADSYRGRRVLVTGHTGFKGSWLALWLTELGANVSGIALAPERGRESHWEALNLDCPSRIVDIRDAPALREAVAEAAPEIVFHLAAQSLVRRSYADPAATWDVNVAGTVNLFEACRAARTVRAIVCVTSDKCYENREWIWGYRETDRLGGHDPYSASKAATEIVAASYRRSFFEAEGIALATARGGNVIGGGDWSEDRLIPDLARATIAGEPLVIRSPRATRPWQHVLDCLSGYLDLGHRLLTDPEGFAEPWNYGPDRQSNLTVEAVLSAMQRRWPDLLWQVADAPQPHEANLLCLDTSKACAAQGWRPVWDFETTIDMTAGWYAAWIGNGQPISRAQLAQYTRDAASVGVPWAAA